jgi:glycosyltransferase involved in cell wall biosynthesis
VRETVVHYTDSNGFGGAERVMLQLLAGLDRARWRPLLLHHGNPALARLVAGARDLGVELREVPTLVRPRDLVHLPSFVRALRGEDAMVFHAHLPAPLRGRYALMAAAAARVPAIVATAHLVSDVAPPSRGGFPQRLAAVCTDRYIAVSEGVAKRMRDRLGVSEGKVLVVYNGIDAEGDPAPSGDGLRTRIAGRSDRPIVLTVARLDTQKGHPYLLAAAAEIPHAVFALVGEGGEQAALESQARALGIAERVRFLGHRDDVPELLAACDVFVLPSLYEGLPLSVLEAMAAAKPVVATAIEGTGEAVVDGVTGLLVPPADPARLAGAIRALLADGTLASRMGEEGRARVRREFSLRKMIDGVTGVYDVLLERTRRRRAG